MDKTRKFMIVVLKYAFFFFLMRIYLITVTNYYYICSTVSGYIIGGEETEGSCYHVPYLRHDILWLVVFPDDIFDFSSI